MSANFTPTLHEYTDLTPFRFWCQKILPLAYDDSLSYYELLCKVVDYLNKTMEDVTLSIEDVQNLHTAYVALEGYVNNYFNNLDVQEEINNKLDALVADGTIHTIFTPDVMAILNVAQQASLDAIAGIPSEVTSWLNQHIAQETGYVIDDTLTVSGAAGDAKVTGDKIGELKSDLDEISEITLLTANILPPSEESGMYNTDTGAKVSDTGYVRTPVAVAIPQGVTQLHGTPRVPFTGFTCILFYTSESISSFISPGGTTSVNNMSGHWFITVPTGAKYFRIWTKNTNSIADLCISTTQISFVAYSAERNIKESALPEALNTTISGLSDSVDEINHDLDEINHDLDEMTDVHYSANILPSTEESGLYDTSTGQKVADSGYVRTPNATEIPEGITKLYATPRVATTGYTCILFYATENENSFISATSVNNLHIIWNISPIPAGAKYFRLWTKSTNAIADICISTERISYVPYSVETVISSKFIPTFCGRLNGKTIVNFGDSITGNFRPPQDISTFLSEFTGATTYNCGFGGCQMTAYVRDGEVNSDWDAFSMYRLAYAIANNDFSYQNSVDIPNVPGMPSYFTDTLATLKSIDFSTVDIITIAYGTNDFASAVSLTEAEAFTSFPYALKYSIEQILTAFPHIQVYVCTPIYRFWMNSDGDFLYDSDTHAISGQYLYQFADTIINVCGTYHIGYIDNYHNLGINKFNRSNYFPETDGTHPNTNGRVLIAGNMSMNII